MIRNSCLAIVFILLPFLLPAADVAAQVQRLEVMERKPLAGGLSFDLAGPYEMLRGKVHFAVDPRAPGYLLNEDLTSMVEHAGFLWDFIHSGPFFVPEPL